jgi:GNAT superfamily N-acetyltransferase
VELSDRLATESVPAYLSRFVTLYPDIQNWYAKVLSEVAAGKRSIFLALRDREICGLAITKFGWHAKLCHISIAPNERAHGLGRLMMEVALAEMLVQGAGRVHVTTGEEVASEYGAFFGQYGFVCSTWQRHRYRRGYDELVWAASAYQLKARLMPRSELAARYASCQDRPARPTPYATAVCAMRLTLLQ